MVGGTVIGVVRGEDTLLNVQDKHDVCAVRCFERRVTDGRAVSIAPGDSVWWQGPWVLWTPKESARTKCDDDYDVRLPKVGYSH